MRRLNLYGTSILVAVCATAILRGAPRTLSLQEAVQLALSQNRALKIARLKVTEAEQRKAQQRASYFPVVNDHAHAEASTGVQHVTIPAGALGAVNGSLVPGQTVNVPQGLNNYALNIAGVSQPLTQLIRIHQANLLAAAETAISRDELQRAENEVVVDVYNLYFGVLVAQVQKTAAQQQTEYAAEQLRESDNDVREGSALRITIIEANASVLQARQSLLTADLQIADLTTALNNVLGLPLNTSLRLNADIPGAPELRPEDSYVQDGWAKNPHILIAQATIRKARAALAAAKSAYIPDVTAYFTNTWQDGVSLLQRNISAIGANVSWDVFDFGKRRAAVREREAQLAEAKENLERLKDDVATHVKQSYDKLARTKDMIDVAGEVAEMRKEGERLARNQSAQGVMTVADRRHAAVAVYSSQADLLQANLNYLIAWAELEKTVGGTPDLHQMPGGRAADAK
jgi:outer membrane protein TolC